MKTKRKNRQKSFFDLTPQERDRYVERFDREIDIEKDTKPLTAKQRALFAKAQKQANGSIYALPLDGRLIDKAAAAARKRGMTLNEFIVEGIRRMTASVRR